MTISDERLQGLIELFYGTFSRGNFSRDVRDTIAALRELQFRRPALAQPSTPEGWVITDEQIKHIVDRFLAWRLPDDFAPDGGIAFQKIGNAGTTYEYTHEPVGTNLLTATQAEDMVRHMLAARPLPPVHAQPKERATHRHKKRGTEYALIGYGKMQAERWVEWQHGETESVDMREVAIYRSVDDGALWVRPREEFEDGRFEALPPAPTAEEV